MFRKKTPFKPEKPILIEKATEVSSTGIQCGSPPETPLRTTHKKSQSCNDSNKSTNELIFEKLVSRPSSPFRVSPEPKGKRYVASSKYKIKLSSRKNSPRRGRLNSRPLKTPNLPNNYLGMHEHSKIRMSLNSKVTYHRRRISDFAKVTKSDPMIVGNKLNFEIPNIAGKYTANTTQTSFQCFAPRYFH